MGLILKRCNYLLSMNFYRCPSSSAFEFLKILSNILYPYLIRTLWLRDFTFIHLGHAAVIWLSLMGKQTWLQIFDVVGRKTHSLKILKCSHRWLIYNTEPCNNTTAFLLIFTDMAAVLIIRTEDIRDVWSSLPFQTVSCLKRFPSRSSISCSFVCTVSKTVLLFISMHCCSFCYIYWHKLIKQSWFILI